MIQIKNYESGDAASDAVLQWAKGTLVRQGSVASYVAFIACDGPRATVTITTRGRARKALGWAFTGELRKRLKERTAHDELYVVISQHEGNVVRQVMHKILAEMN